jgi:hypothetical protein
MSVEVLEKIDFRQERTFSELISVTFNYIKQEFKNLVKPVIFKFAPIAFAIFFGFDIICFFMNPGFAGQPFSDTPLTSIVRNIIYLLFFFCLQIIIFSYIKVYIDNNGETDKIKVRKTVLAFIAPAFAWTSVPLILILFVMILSIMPEVPRIIMIAMSFLSETFLVLLPLFTVPSVFFDKSHKDWPVKRSIKLIKGYWWFTFGLVVIFDILIYALVLIFAMPYFIAVKIGILTGFLIPHIYSSFISILAMILHAFSAILLSFHYFNLVERKEMQSNLNRIEDVSLEQ